MKKICNILLVMIIIAIIIVVALIAIKYTKNQINEQELSKVIETINKEITQEEVTQEKQMYYKEYRVVGIIKIPSIELEYPILEITNNTTRRLSITKLWEKGVNEIGNLSLAGHNNYDGTMFGKTKQLETGDKIELTDMKGITKNYIIYEKFITDPNNISVIETDEYGTREVTLITCSNGNKERLILKAREEVI